MREPARMSLVSLTFGTGGNALPYQRNGWSVPEAGFTWSIGAASELVLPVEQIPGDLVLELEVRPFQTPRQTQRSLIVDANGQTIGRQSFVDTAIVWFGLPHDNPRAGGELRLTFRHDGEAASPQSAGASGDTRELGFMFWRLEIRAAPPKPPCTPARRPPLPGHDQPGRAAAAKAVTGLELADLPRYFESLGRNCEFGLVQAHCGDASMGLMRFGSIDHLQLLRAARAGFGGGDAAHVDVYLEPQDRKQEWMLRDGSTGIVSHTFRYAWDTDQSRMQRLADMRFSFLRRKLLETLADGSKICVFQHPNLTGAAQIRAIAAALRDFGPNMLLWVSEDNAQPPGTVEMLEAGLMHGFIDRLAPTESAQASNIPAWISLMANAYRLWREAGHGQDDWR